MGQFQCLLAEQFSVQSMGPILAVSSLDNTSMASPHVDYTILYPEPLHVKKVLPMDFKMTYEQEKMQISCRYYRCCTHRRRKTETGNDKKGMGRWVGNHCHGDHPSDSGTDTLLREKAKRSASLLVNLVRFCAQVLPGDTYGQRV